MITQGNWKLLNSAVITNLRPDRIGYSHEEFDSEYKYYGGYLVCESICNSEDGKLIESSKDLLLILEEIVFVLEVSTPKQLPFSMYIEYKKVLSKIKGYKHSPFYLIPEIYKPIQLSIKPAPKYFHHSYLSK